jgi:ABC-type sugar transport system ATPase subunit
LRASFTVDTNPRSPAIQKALKARKLSYTYPGGEKAALEDFSADFLPGEIHALIGDNGAGKTTLVKLIAGALPLQAGQLIWGEEELKKSRADRLNLGISWIPKPLSLPWILRSGNILSSVRKRAIPSV